MSIHSGHPEKYDEATRILAQAVRRNVLLSDQAIEQCKTEGAWIPLALQREKLTKFSQQQQIPQTEDAKSGEKDAEIDFRIEPEGDFLVKGITNVGNTCYMGSFLQLLFHSAPFLRDLLAFKPSNAGSLGSNSRLVV